MGPFEFANTTVRSGSRLRDGLLAIRDSGKEGSLRGHSGDIALIEILTSNEVIDFFGENTFSVGRKWRSALCKMGFLFDRYVEAQEEIGSADWITPNGRRLIEANSLAAQQEIFLRAIAAMQLYFDGKSFKVGPGFSPFKHILRILFALEGKTGSSEISLIEFASYCQFEPNLYSLEEIVESIIEYRAGRFQAKNKKSYDTECLKKSVAKNGRVALSSYVDYADENLRYLKSTGCFSTVGRGVAISKSKRDLIFQLVEDIPENSNYVDYWSTITSGARLPTDSTQIAFRNLEAVKAEASSRGIIFDRSIESLDAKELNNARYDLEELIALNQELDFAHSQASKWEEILEYLAAVLPKNARPFDLVPEISLEIPRGEGPAYLEWAVWRAFLAINEIKTPPHESRRFRIDRDFLPISPAPGRGPDLIFEFQNYILIVEVTLLTSDRQAAAEQVSVRRHVYEIAKYTENKPVFCLFLAPSIRNETARDFKSASYEEDDGSDLNLTIIPLSIRTFMQTFSYMLKNDKPNSQLFMDLIKQCAELAKETQNTSLWMSAIEKKFLEKTR